MTQDEIIEMARQVGEDWWADDLDLEFFANLVAQRAQAEEREAWSEEIIDDLHALYDSEMIKENDSGDALIRLDEAVCVVEEVAQRNTNLPQQEAKDEPVACWCHKCNENELVNGIPFAMTRMILCPKCGNKRCPKASDHTLQCTNSNEPNQAGSVYTTPPQRTWVGLTDEEIEVIEVLRAPPVHPDFVDCDDWVEFARAIENKLRELNT